MRYVASVSSYIFNLIDTTAKLVKIENGLKLEYKKRKILKIKRTKGLKVSEIIKTAQEIVRKRLWTVTVP